MNSNNKKIILSYYSSLDFGNLCMLLGFLEKNKSSNICLPSTYPLAEKLILEKNGVKNVEVIYLLNPLSLIKLLRRADSIHLICGDSLTGNYGLLSKFFTIYNLILANLKPKRCVIESSTIFPTKFNLSLLKLLIYPLKKIYLREKTFLSYCRKTFNKNVESSNDLATIYLNEKKASTEKSNLICVTIRNSTPQLLGINRIEFIEKIAKQFQIFLEKNSGYSMVFLPFQFGIKYKSDDRNILTEIYYRLPRHIQKRVTIITEIPTLQDIVNIISKSKIVISTRLHPCIFAHALNTKFIAINEQRKIEEFTHERGLLIKSEDLNELEFFIEKILKTVD